MMKSETIGKLAEALAKAQGAIEGAKKDKANPFFKSKYADLASVWDACREPLSSNGLSVVQLPGIAEHGIKLTTILMHASGEWLSDEVTGPLKEQTPQAIGSLITYLRRYALSAIAGVAPEDDDGEQAMGRQASRDPQHKPNGNGHKAPEKASPIPPEEQIAIRLIEACEAGFATAADREAWKEKVRPEFHKLPQHLQKAVKEATEKAEVRS